MTLDYYNQNSLRKYPFKDYSYGVALVDIPNDCFVDAQIVFFNSAYFRTYLSALDRSSSNLVVTIGFANQAGTELHTLVITVAISSLVIHDTLTVVDQNYASVKLVVGPGLKDWASTHDTNPTCNLANSEFATSAVVMTQAMVTGVSMININTVNNTEVLLHAFDVSNPLEIHAGANLLLGGDTSTLNASVKAKAGQGLYDGCLVDGSIPLYHINNIAPDTNGNFVIQGGPCYNRTMGAGFLTFVHTCDSACNEQDYKSLAYYMNRLSDAANDLYAFALTTKNGYDVAAASIKAKIEANAAYKPAYMKMDHTVVRYVKQDFANCALAIHLPNKEKITGTLTFDLGSHMSVVDRSADLSIDNVSVRQASAPGFTAMHLNCKKNVFQRFALSANRLVDVNSNLQDVWNKDSNDAGYYVAALLTHSRGVAYYYTPLFKRNTGFTIAYNYHYAVVNSLPGYYINFELDFFDSENRTANTFFQMQLPAGLNITPGTLKLWVDETVTAIDPAIARPPGWGDLGGDMVAMNFTKKNRLTFSAVWSGDPCTDTLINDATLTFNPLFVVIDSDAHSWDFTKTFQISFHQP